MHMLNPVSNEGTDAWVFSAALPGRLWERPKQREVNGGWLVARVAAAAPRSTATEDVNGGDHMLDHMFGGAAGNSEDRQRVGHGPCLVVGQTVPGPSLHSTRGEAASWKL